MNLDNLSEVSYTVEDDGTLLTLTFTDPSGPTELGTIRIAKDKARPFFETMVTISRETHDVFQGHYDATTTMRDKSSGTISYR